MEEPKRNLDSTKPQRISDRYGINTINKGFFKRNGKRSSEDDYKLSSIRGLFISTVLFLYWEILISLFTFGTIGKNVVFMFASSLMLASVVSLASAIFQNNTINYIISLIIKILLAVLFISQIIYFEVKESFFAYDTDFSQISFSNDIVPVLMVSWWKILLVLLPLIISIIVYVLYSRINEDILGYAKRSIVSYLFLIVMGILGYGILFFSVALSDSRETPVYEVYSSREADYNEKIGNLGIITSMVQDICYDIFEK